MKVFTSLEELPVFKNLVLTQGTFDGVHQGHLKVLRSVVEQARGRGNTSMLLTFYPHPRLVVNPDDNSLRMLSSIKEKEELIAQTGIDYLMVLPFTSEVSKYSPEQFVKEILVDKLDISSIIVGYDHRFGYQREGDLDILTQLGKKYDFEVSEIKANEVDNMAISSTRIRKSLLEGRLEEANELLGRYYSFSGVVVHGQKNGRKMGFPTVNIQPDDPYKLIPAPGVYAAIASFQGKRHKCAMNIGFNPTFGNFGMTIEGYLLNFEGDLYGANLKFEMVSRIRSEIKFNSIEELKHKISEDVEATEALLQGV